MEKERDSILRKLTQTQNLHHLEPAFYHGRLFKDAEPPLDKPDTSWDCEWLPRTDSETSCAWLTASEFTDQEEVLQTKVDCLVKLLKLSKKTIIYSGAGVSTAAGG